MVRSAGSTDRVRPAWTMPTWMRCPATTRAPRLDTRRWSRIGSAAGTGGGPAGRASRRRAISGRGERVGQAAQQDAVRGQLQHAVVDPDGDASAGELDPDGML